MNREPQITTQHKLCNRSAMLFLLFPHVIWTCVRCSCSYVRLCIVHFGCICNQSMVNINKRRKLKTTEANKFDQISTATKSNLCWTQIRLYQSALEIEWVSGFSLHVPIAFFLFLIFFAAFSTSSCLMFYLHEIMVFDVFFLFFLSSSFCFINIWVHFAWLDSGWFWRQWRRCCWRWWWLRRPWRRWRWRRQQNQTTL